MAEAARVHVERGPPARASIWIRPAGAVPAAWRRILVISLLQTCATALSFLRTTSNGNRSLTESVFSKPRKHSNDGSTRGPRLLVFYVAAERWLVARSRTCGRTIELFGCGPSD